MFKNLLFWCKVNLFISEKQKKTAINFNICNKFCNFAALNVQKTEKIII